MNQMLSELLIVELVERRVWLWCGIAVAVAVAIIEEEC